MWRFSVMRLITLMLLSLLSLSPSALADTGIPADDAPLPGQPPAALAGQWHGERYGMVETLDLDGQGNFTLVSNDRRIVGGYAIQGQELVLLVVGHPEPLRFPILASGSRGFAIMGPKGRFDYALVGPARPGVAQEVAQAVAVLQAQVQMSRNTAYTHRMMQLQAEHQAAMSALEMQRAASQASHDMINEMLGYGSTTYEYQYDN